ncbi:MAG: 50S ribosomal protein L4 [Bacilli bacterium]|nr:50S ribosomal protein L4 [Mycoplasmatota bacterium]MEE0014444.1 50S ribosomal protein L4 [Bacilli bacterium]
MKKVELLNLKGEKVKDINLNEEIFGITPNKAVLKDAIILTMASLRQGTHKTKNRSEVSGGGRKPWRQKGTGRARQGSIRAVQWVGGGNYGTPVPRDYSKKQNRKERQLALKSALSDKAIEKSIIVVENISLATPKTKEMVNLLETLKLADKKVLMVVKEFDDNLILASRNLQNVVLILAEEINVLDLVGTDVMLITEEALKTVEEVLK